APAVRAHQTASAYDVHAAVASRAQHLDAGHDGDRPWRTFTRILRALLVLLTLLALLLLLLAGRRLLSGRRPAGRLRLLLSQQRGAERRHGQQGSEREQFRSVHGILGGNRAAAAVVWEFG